MERLSIICCWLNESGSKASAESLKDVSSRDVEIEVILVDSSINGDLVFFSISESSGGKIIGLIECLRESESIPIVALVKIVLIFANIEASKENLSTPKCAR